MTTVGDLMNQHYRNTHPEEAGEAPAKESPTPAKRRTELHVIDQGGDEHMLAVWHEESLELEEQFGRLYLYEGAEQRTLATFPLSYAVLLHEDPLDPALTEVCTEFAREVAIGLKEESPRPGDAMSCYGWPRQARERVLALNAEAERLKGELERLIASGYEYVTTETKNRMAAEARRILDSEVKLEPGGKTFVTFKRDDRPGVAGVTSYEVDHDDEDQTAWRIVAYLTNELSKLAEGADL